MLFAFITSILFLVFPFITLLFVSAVVFIPFVENVHTRLFVYIIFDCALCMVSYSLLYWYFSWYSTCVYLCSLSPPYFPFCHSSCLSHVLNSCDLPMYLLHNIPFEQPLLLFLWSSAPLVFLYKILVFFARLYDFCIWIELSFVLNTKLSLIYICFFQFIMYCRSSCNCKV